jgi:hypothetical protein
MNLLLLLLLRGLLRQLLLGWLLRASCCWTRTPCSRPCSSWHPPDQHLPQEFVLLA